jgi:class 3 adenylate cyclase
MNVITVLGDTANTTARLASAAGTGEIYISEDSCRHGIGSSGNSSAAEPVDSLELKGRAEPLPVRVMKVEPAA